MTSASTRSRCRSGTRSSATSRTTASASATYNTFTIQPDVVGATSATWSWEVTVPYEGEWEVGAIAVDTEGQADLREGVRTWLVSATAVPPTVDIATPAVMIPPTAIPALTMAPGSPVTFSGTATDDEGLHDVEITLRNSATGENLAADGTWGINVNAGNYRDLAARHRRDQLQLVVHDTLQPDVRDVHLLREGDRRPRS